tara:strand:+ start:210 stop:515 length:306 start_codon:yes stop_codon:yes gene_type:complete
MTKKELPPMNRFELLEATKETVADRGEDYGSIWENHERIAIIWTALIGIQIEPEHVAMMMAGVKLARLAATPDHQDSWVDLAGYAATGSECLYVRKNNAND